MLPSMRLKGRCAQAYELNRVRREFLEAEVTRLKKKALGSDLTGGGAPVKVSADGSLTGISISLRR